jgi:hypothetical protein
MRLPEWLKKGGIPMGSASEFKAGSVERAKLLTIDVISSWELATTTGEKWEWEVQRAKKENAHQLLGFKTFDEYLQKIIGQTEAAAKQRFETKADTNAGRPKKSGTVPNNGQLERAQRNGVSDRTQRYLDHLARDAPELLERVNTGELKPKTAARMAGVVKEPSAVEQVLRLLPKLVQYETDVHYDFQSAW